MKPPDTSWLASSLTASHGLPFTVNAGTDQSGHPFVDVAPSGIHPNEGFSIHVTLYWRRIVAQLRLGAFASALIHEMGTASDSAKKIFVALAEEGLKEKAALTLTINGQPSDPLKPDFWPEGWQRMTLEFEKGPLAVNTEDAVENDRHLLRWTSLFLSLSLALMPLEEEDAVNPEGLPEGAKARVEVNRYERSRLNRAACLDIHGLSCLACGFNFEFTYGSTGAGFIHVHHVVPVSLLGPDYLVNPATDLIPLCPNCHAMAHTRMPPLELAHLRSLLGGPRKDST